MKTGMTVFDEDYYRYFYATYDFDKTDAIKWLGVTLDVFNYLDMMDVKRGKTDLKIALEDYHNLDVGLRLKIKNYFSVDEYPSLVIARPVRAVAISW